MTVETTSGTKKDGMNKIQKFLNKFESQGGRMEEIALKIGVSYSTVVAWKYGTRAPGGSARILIEKLYGTNLV